MMAPNPNDLPGVHHVPITHINTLTIRCRIWVTAHVAEWCATSKKKTLKYIISLPGTTQKS